MCLSLSSWAVAAGHIRPVAEEAAMDLGATPVKTFFRFTLLSCAGDLSG